MINDLTAAAPRANLNILRAKQIAEFIGSNLNAEVANVAGTIHLGSFGAPKQSQEAQPAAVLSPPSGAFFSDGASSASTEKQAENLSGNSLSQQESDHVRLLDEVTNGLSDNSSVQISGMNFRYTAPTEVTTKLSAPTETLSERLNETIKQHAMAQAGLQFKALVSRTEVARKTWEMSVARYADEKSRKPSGPKLVLEVDEVVTDDQGRFAILGRWVDGDRWPQLVLTAVDAPTSDTRSAQYQASGASVFKDDRPRTSEALFAETRVDRIDIGETRLLGRRCIAAGYVHDDLGHILKRAKISLPGVESAQAITDENGYFSLDSRVDLKFPAAVACSRKGHATQIHQSRGDPFRADFSPPPTRSHLG